MDSAKETFLALLGELPNDQQRMQFVEWIRKDVIDAIPAGFGCDQHVVDARVKLKQVSDKIRQWMPSPAAVLPSEVLYAPDSDTGSTTVTLDEFLYDDKDEEELFDQGLIPRSVCLNCGSHNTRNIECITHSFSKSTLENIFCALLPDLSGKTILDVGSRLGAVLYGAYLFSAAKGIIGVEMNGDFCKIQRDAVHLFGMADRVMVVEAEMTSRPDLMAAADVVVLHNVWQWFVPGQEEQVKLWQFAWQHIKPGALIVTYPPLDQSLATLNTGIVLTQWVRELNPTFPDRFTDCSLDDSEEADRVRLYQVIKPSSIVQ